MRVAITGSSGLIGSALARAVSKDGGAVVAVVRREARPAEARWDPQSGIIDPEAFAGVDAVVHLAGENVGAQRWTPAFKDRLVRSRVDATRGLARSLAALPCPPRTLVCASAIGFYGDRGDDLVDEDSPPGTGFFPDLVRAWEAAAEPAREAGIRVVHLRFGVVLAPAGGALDRLVPIFRACLGGRTGSGRQWMSWVAIDDVVGAALRALSDASLAGAVNVVAPEPATNRDFAQTLAHVLGRPAFLPLPAFAVRLALGELGENLLLAGARVRPARLAEAGHVFRHPSLEGALRSVLGRA